MGLTIHYGLQSNVRAPRKARELVERLRQRALDLPFQRVGELIELNGDDCDFEKRDNKDPLRWLLIQAGQYVDRPAKHGGLHSYSVAPTRIIAFETFPGPDCEPANFGLCRYPATIEIKGDEEYVIGKGWVRPKRRLRTRLPGWSWSSFCKTQYSSAPECGGVENFLRCHLSVIKLLDFASELGVLSDVSDEGGYWQTRDVEALARDVGDWNEMIAGFAGRLKDLLGGSVESPIFRRQDFEHLEAKANIGNQP